MNIDWNWKPIVDKIRFLTAPNNRFSKHHYAAPVYAKSIKTALKAIIGYQAAIWIVFIIIERQNLHIKTSKTRKGLIKLFNKSSFKLLKIIKILFLLSLSDGWQHDTTHKVSTH